MYPDYELKAKLEAQTYKNQDQCATQAVGVCAGRAPYTLCEEAAKSEQHHYEEAAKAGSAARFLSSHPEFDEFIRLVRSGAIRF